MTPDFTATFNGTYLRIEHPRGYEVTELGVIQLWREVAELCQKHQCFKVLSVLVAPTRTISVTGSFDSGKAASRFLRGIRVACCMLEYEPDHKTELFKNTAYNRGVNIAVFTNEKAALEWLGVNCPVQDCPGGS